MIFAFLVFQNLNSCTSRQFSITDDIRQYEITLDPEVCVALAERIFSHNAECGSDLEPVDCG